MRAAGVCVPESMVPVVILADCNFAAMLSERVF